MNASSGIVRVFATTVLSVALLCNIGGSEFPNKVESPDPNSLRGKLMMGYQGWFTCPGDGSSLDKWQHWFRHQSPVATNATVDFWPDIAELDSDELFATGM